MLSRSGTCGTEVSWVRRHRGKQRRPPRRERPVCRPRGAPAFRMPSGVRRQAPHRQARCGLLAEVERLQAELAAARSRMAELEAKADVDPLLDIFNRRGFERELDRSLAYVQRYGNPAALVYLDLDGFKPVNDAHGHAAGDAVLKAVAATLAARSAPPTRWRGSAATSSRCCCGTSTPPLRTRKAEALEGRIAATAVRFGGQRA